jgi:Rod binding domain-containing protein
MMMDQKLSEDLAHRGGGIGLQKVLYEQMTRTPSRMPQTEENRGEKDPAIKKSLKTD